MYFTYSGAFSIFGEGCAPEKFIRSAGKVNQTNNKGPFGPLLLPKRYRVDDLPYLYLVIDAVHVLFAEAIIKIKSVGQRQDAWVL